MPHVIRNINQLKAGVMLSYLTMGIGYIVSLVYTSIMLKLLGQSEYGLYNLVATVITYLGVLNFGFGSAYIRYYSRYKTNEDHKKIATINGMFLIIFSVIGIIAVVAGTVLSMNTEIIFGSELTSIELSKSRILMLILVVNLAISFPNIVFASHITANEEFIFQNLVQLVKIVVNPFIVLPVLLLGYGSVGLVVMTTSLNVAIEIANATYCIKKLKMKFSFKDFDTVLMREMTVFSSFVFMNLVIDQINWNVDKYVLGRFHGTIAVAIYGLAAHLNMYYLSISTAISSVFVPRVHRLVASSSNLELTQLFTKVGRIQFILLSLISSGLIFFGKPFIQIWAGKNYSDSYTIALILIIPITIPLIQNIGIEIQRAKNMHQFRSWIYLLIALMNLALTIPLARLYSGIGASIGTAISMIIGNGLIMNLYYHIKVGLDIKFFWKQILSFVPALIIPAIFGILINKLFDLNNIFYFLIFGMIYIVIFGSSMWIFGLNKFEKFLISSPVLKYWNRLLSKHI